MADAELSPWELVLSAVKQRHNDFIASRLNGAARAEALAAAEHATSDQTKLLLAVCLHPVKWFVAEELDPTQGARNAAALAIAMRKALKRTDPALVKTLLAPHIERLLVTGLGTAATLVAPISSAHPEYALADDLESFLLPTQQPVTYKLWCRSAPDLIQNVLQGPPETRQVIGIIGHGDVAIFLQAASAVGKLGDRKLQRTLGELANVYLLYGYALYRANTHGVRERVAAQLPGLWAEVALEGSAPFPGLPFTRPAP